MTTVLRVGMGCLLGALVGMVGFVSVSVVFFALGVYSHHQLTLGAGLGLIWGALAGPWSVWRRRPLARGVLGPALVSVGVFTGYLLWLGSQRSVFTSWEQFRSGLLAGSAFVLLASGLSAMACLRIWDLLPSDLANSWEPRG